MKKIQTLCLIYQPPKILLGLKKRGFGANRWNGFGGKLNPGETPEQAMIREVKEEVGLTIDKFHKIGIIKFIFQNNPETLEVHFFQANEFTGQPQETEEMKPQWFNIDQVPFAEMWPDDPYWFPYFLAGKKFRGQFTFADQNKIINYKLNEVNW